MATWILAFLKAGGYLALVLLAAIECFFPPLPSELIFPLAGYLDPVTWVVFALLILWYLKRVIWPSNRSLGDARSGREAVIHQK